MCVVCPVPHPLPPDPALQPWAPALWVLPSPGTPSLGWEDPRQQWLGYPKGWGGIGGVSAFPYPPLPQLFCFVQV